MCSKGYLKGRPIISGYKLATDTDVNTVYHLRTSGQRLLNGVLCGTIGLSERELIRFGFNTSSSCVVQVAFDDLKSSLGCLNLKRIVFQKLNSYFAPANYVSKNGNPDSNGFNESDWINVYPSTRTYLNEEIAGQLNFSLNTCLNVPYRINVWFFYQRVGKSNGEEVFEIVGSYVR